MPHSSTFFAFTQQLSTLLYLTCTLACVTPPAAGDDRVTGSSGPAMFTESTGASKPKFVPGYSLNSPALADSDHVGDPRLIGYWEYRGPHGVVTLEFVSHNRLIFAGNHVSYETGEGVILVKDEVGHMEYPYRINGDRLVLEFKEEERPGIALTFVRVDLTAPGSGKR